MKLVLYKKKLKDYFEIFSVSREMAEAWEVVLGCRCLKNIYIDFKISSIKYKEKCAINVIEEKSGQFEKCNMLAIAELFLSRKSFLKLSKIEKFANSKKIRIGYSVRDEKPLILKLYLIFDRGLVFEKELIQLITELGFDFIRLPDQKDFSLGVEFQGEKAAFSLYEHYHGLPKKYLDKSSIKNFLKGTHYNKDAYYLCVKKYSSENKIIYSKITKIYNRNHRFALIKKDIKKVMGEKIYKKLNKDFKDYIIDSLCLRIEDDKRNTYIIPRGCSSRSFD